MIKWENRSKEIAYLLNPAFCGVILAIASSEYYKKSKKALPLLLVYVILPLLLHKPTRIKIPKTSRLTFSTWLENYPVIRIDFFNNAIQLKPYINEALIFSINNNIVEIEGDGLKSNLKLNTILRLFTNDDLSEMNEFITKSSLLGKWFGNLNSTSLVYSLLEIRP